MITELLLAAILALQVWDKIRPKMERTYKHWRTRRSNR